jgi:hypothetical protein
MPNILRDADIIMTSAPHLTVQKSTGGAQQPWVPRLLCSTAGLGQRPDARARPFRPARGPQADQARSAARGIPCRGQGRAHRRRCRACMRMHVRVGTLRADPARQWRVSVGARSHCASAGRGSRASGWDAWRTPRGRLEVGCMGRSQAGGFSFLSVVLAIQLAVQAQFTHLKTGSRPVSYSTASGTFPYML